MSRKTTYPDAYEGVQMQQDIDNLAAVARILLEIDHAPRTPLEIAKAVDKACKFLFPYRPYNAPERQQYTDTLQRDAFMVIMKHFPS